MALTKAEIDNIAERVLDLAKERGDAAMEKWKAERDEKRKSPDGLALRVSDLEESVETWRYATLFCLVLTVLFVIFPPRRAVLVESGE